MSSIDRIYLCFEGILVPRLSDMILDCLLAQNIHSDQRFQKLLIEKDRELFLRRITFEEYIDHVNQTLVQKIMPHNVLDWISNNSYWNHEAAELIAEMVGKKNYLICGIPEFLVNIWSQKLKQLPIDEIIYSDKLYLENYFESILDCIIQNNLELLDTVLWIDPHPFRTSRMIQKGGNALIYVDPYRTRREFVMRGIL